MKTENLTAAEGLQAILEGKAIMAHTGGKVWDKYDLDSSVYLQTFVRNAPFLILGPKEQPKQDVWGERKYPAKTTGIVSGYYIPPKEEDKFTTPALDKVIEYAQSDYWNECFYDLLKIIRDEARKIAKEEALSWFKALEKTKEDIITKITKLVVKEPDPQP